LGLAIHGGTGSFLMKDIPSYINSIYKDFFRNIIDVNYDLLIKGEYSLNIVEKVIIEMENSSLFNAGKGSLQNKDKLVSLDASIMDGKRHLYGSIFGVNNIKNPISVAKKILIENEGCYSAEYISKQLLGEFDFVSKKYFSSDKLWLKLLDSNNYLSNKNGTVGCVVLDQKGNLASGTSTGGLVNKLSGRISDSAIIGSGTYANNRTCAISCSGYGESIIRNNLAFYIHSIISNKKVSADKAVKIAFKTISQNLKYNVGLICIDKFGKVIIHQNANSMLYAYKSKHFNFNIFE